MLQSTYKDLLLNLLPAHFDLIVGFVLDDRELSISYRHRLYIMHHTTHCIFFYDLLLLLSDNNSNSNNSNNENTLFKVNEGKNL